MANSFLDDEVDPTVKARQDHFAQLERDALKITLQTRTGRRFIWSLLGKCGFARQAFVPGMSDATAFNNGKQDLAYQIIAEIDAIDSNYYYLMSKESKEDQELYDRPTSNNNDSGTNSGTGITSANSSANSIGIIAGREQ